MKSRTSASSHSTDVGRRVVHVLAAPPDVWGRRMVPQLIKAICTIRGFRWQSRPSADTTDLVYESRAVLKTAREAIARASRLGMTARLSTWQAFRREGEVGTDELVRLMRAGDVAGLWDLLQAELVLLYRPRRVEGFDLSRCDLRGMAFIELVRFFGCRFDRAVLDGMDFNDFELCSFKGASLRGARVGGTINGCNFASADLSRANISVVSTTRKVRPVNFKNACLEGASIRFLAVMPRDQLKGIRGVCFDGARLSRCRFDVRSLRGCTFKKADLRGARLRGVDLRGCDFRGADLTGADLRGAKTDAQTFRGALLTR